MVPVRCSLGAFRFGQWALEYGRKGAGCTWGTSKGGRGVSGPLIHNPCRSLGWGAVRGLYDLRSTIHGMIHCHGQGRVRRQVVNRTVHCTLYKHLKICATVFKNHLWIVFRFVLSCHTATPGAL